MDEALEEAHERTTGLSQQAIVQDLERQFMEVSQERNDLKQQLVVVGERLASAQQTASQQSDLQVQLEQQKHAASMTETKLQALQEEKKLTEERLDRVLAEADNLRQEIR